MNFGKDAPNYSTSLRKNFLQDCRYRSETIGNHP